MVIENIIDKVQKYLTKEEIERIVKAYKVAEKMHEGQMRQSGEKYIIHPLEVTNILVDFEADADTLCAALLHDVIEDTEMSKEEIENEFNKDIADLVDAVTKFGKLTYKDSDELFAANHRKMLMAASQDVRSVLIKLADRLHNMRTLEYKSPYKQKEKSLETMEIYVPLAYYVGAYVFKNELEDISFGYLKPRLYKDIKEKLEREKDKANEYIEIMCDNIHKVLDEAQIKYETRIGSKTVYGTYKKLYRGRSIKDIHNLFEITIVVDSVENCYKTLGKVHSIYVPVNNKFKDYISLPKTNLYTSLHTTVFGKKDQLVQVKIRTKEMDKINIYGIGAYYSINGKEAYKTMKQDLTEKFQFFKSLIEINKTIEDNKEFIGLIKNEILTTNVYVYSPKGDAFELPKGSTALDFAYKLHTKIGSKMNYALVNNKFASKEYVVKNKDIIKIVVEENVTVSEADLDIVKTTYAKNKVKECLKGKK